MPFAVIVVGILMIVVAIRNTYAQLATELVDDFTGPNNFFYWIAALFVIGAVGYIDELKVPSRMMLALVLITLLLSNRGFFEKFVQELKSGSAQAPPPGPPPPSLGGSATAPGGAVGGGGAGSGIGGTLGGAAGTAVGGPVGGALGGTIGNVLGGILKI